MKKALITGITGQDGSYLADLLLEKGYEVHGIIRRASTFNTSRIDHLYADPHINGVRLFLHYGDLADSVNLVKLLYELKPDEIYHLGAQSHVRVSFDIPEYTSDVTGVGTIRILEAIRETGIRSQFLPGFEQRDVRQSAGGAADRDDAFLAAQPVRRGEGFRLLGDGELSRKLRPVREQRHSVQPRKPAARRNVRDAQNHARGGGDKATACRRSCSSATSMRNATGVTRRNMSKGCGASCSTTKATTSCSRRTRRIRSANSSRPPSATSISIGRIT